MSAVLVTGGAGFIGSHLVDRLLADGHSVTVLDNLVTGARENVPPDAELVIADAADAEAVRSTFAIRGLDAVLHVAGQASIVRSFSAPERDLEANVIGTLNVIAACIEYGVPRLVYASSMTAYGEPDLIPTPETAPCMPVSYYGVTKYAAERYVQIAGALASSDLETTSLRMFNVYGERQSLTNPYQGVLAIFIGNLLRGEPLTIHGDGRQTRDFVYVQDAVDAWACSLDATVSHGRVYNVGSGRETTIAELADAVLEAFGVSRSTWDVRSAPEPPGVQRRSASDLTRIRSELGWEPRVALQLGMERTIAWARSA